MPIDFFKKIFSGSDSPGPDTERFGAGETKESNLKTFEKDRKKTPLLEKFKIPSIEGTINHRDKFITANEKVYMFFGFDEGNKEVVLCPEDNAKDDSEKTTRMVQGAKRVPLGEFIQNFERTGGNLFYSEKPFSLRGDEFEGAENFKGRELKIVGAADEQNIIKISDPKDSAFGIKAVPSENLPANAVVRENEHVIYKDSQGDLVSGKVVRYIGDKLILGFGADSGEGMVERPQVELGQVIAKTKTAGDAQKKLEIFKKEKDAQAAEDLINEITGSGKKEKEKEIGLEDVQKLSQKINANIDSLKPKIQRHEYNAIVAEYNRAISQDHNYEKSYELLKELENKLSAY